MEINMEIGIRFRCSETILPMNHQYNIQSMIYKGLSEDSAYASFLHDSGYMFGSRQFRLFTFSRLSGYYQIRQGCLIYPEAVVLRVRSIDPRMIRLLCSSFFPGSEHVLCGQKLVVEEYTVSDYHICTDSISFTTCSPLVAYRTVKGERARFFTPDDPEFYELLSDNAERKWTSYYKEPAPGTLEISPLEGVIKKVVAEYKGTYVTGWMGAFHAEGPQSLLDFLYQTGIGAKTAQGFGMIDIS